MNVEGAIITEQGVTFSIVVVKPRILRNSSECDNMRRSLQRVFPSPIILMAQDSHGIPTYQGRTDIVKFLANIHISQIPWKRYAIS